MQCMISHETPLQPCQFGHTARHMHDKRRMEAGGGHNIECKCSHTGRHDDFDSALREWEQMHAPAKPAATAGRKTRKIAKAAEVQPAPTSVGVITSLDSMQREAMRRAQSGDFELAAAMELLSAGRTRAGRHLGGAWREYDLQFGIWIGGRLQAFAYGSPLTCYDDECTDVDCACDDEADTRLVIGLNEAVLFSSFDEGGIPDAYTNGRSPMWAQGVIDAYREQLAKPVQKTMLQLRGRVMHATIDSSVLASALKLSVAPTTSPHPTIMHARVQADGESLVFETTDTATYMRHTLPCSVKEPGCALLRVSLLRPIASAPGEIVLRDDGKVSRGRSNFKVPAAAVEAWPAEREENWQAVSIDPEVLAVAIKSAGYAADDETIYTNIRGLHIDNGLVWGSDGVSLSYVAVNYTGPSITVPDGQVSRLLGLLQEGAKIEIGGVNGDLAGVLRVTAGQQQLSIRLLGAKSTDIRQIVKNSCYASKHSSIKRDPLWAAVKRFLPFATILGETKNKGLPVIILAMVNGELYLADRAEENREVISDAVLAAGPDFRAALDPRRLISALAAVDSNVVALHAPEKGKGIASWLMYEDEGDPDVTAHIIVPMNL